MDSATLDAWQEYELGDLIDIFDSKRIPLSGKQRAERKGPYPYYGASGVIDHIDDYIFDGTYILIAEDGENLNSRKLPIAFFAREKFWVNNHAHIVKGKPGICDDYFLTVWFAQANISGYITGAAQPKLSQGNLKRIKVRFPPYDTQIGISEVLSAYDDLIENNTRRIKILEEMAQTIYRGWFVKFRFPGHEKVRMTDSSLGPIPEGWEVKRASEAIEVNPRTKVPKDGEKPFVPMGSLLRDSMLIGQVELRIGNSGSKFRNGDTLFARITPCLENGKTGFVQFLPTNDDAGFGSTEFIVLRSKTLCPQFVYLMSRTDEFRGNAIKSMTGASGRQRVQVECFDKYLFPHPDQQTLSAFSDVMSILFRQINVLAKKNVVLHNARDLLLPRLISGDLSLDAVDDRAVALG